jgi:hypothetical protein
MVRFCRDAPVRSTVLAVISYTSAFPKGVSGSTASLLVLKGSTICLGERRSNAKQIQNTYKHKFIGISKQIQQDIQPTEKGTVFEKATPLIKGLRCRIGLLPERDETVDHRANLSPIKRSMRNILRSQFPDNLPAWA